MADRPLARGQDLVVEPLGDELLVFDATVHRAHSLNAFAAAVWHACDGPLTPAISAIPEPAAARRAAISVRPIRPSAASSSSRARSRSAATRRLAIPSQAPGEQHGGDRGGEVQAR